MASNVPIGFPEAIYDSKLIADAFARQAVTPEMVRGCPTVTQALQNGEFDNQFMRGLSGLPFYMAHTAPSDESSAIAFDRHFNPQLKHDSEYFRNLNAVLSCVERNAASDLTPEQENKVCAGEFKKLRLATFKNELLYHNVNKRFYMDLISMKRHEAPF